MLLQSAVGSATVRALQQYLATVSALQLNAWLDSARLVIPTASLRLCAHINATLLGTDFDKIWLFHINPARGIR